MVKVLYKLFLAIMIALFVGFGVSVFYPTPKAPDYPMSLERIDGKTMTAEQKKVEDDYLSQQKEFEKQFAVYNRNISAIIIGISILLLILSLTLLLPIEIIGDAVLLGGLFTLVYGIIRGIMTQDSKFQFIVVTVGLVVAIVLGYVKFIKPKNK